ncbi:hypothetical protein MicloDRAFT_00064810 [Microvirga lotononidis]|uniref:Uncharacterized protein n=2 Tax=Microvirga lotononidis TaxID=864069 RepID=I4YP62_9HYPH|nr:hypothetical protein MicloDRAFT_00064810 [Microvirga lotononidis]
MGLPQGNGILGGFEDYARNNQASLLGMAAGLMSGDGFAAGLQGYSQGAVQDQRTRLLKQAEAEKQQQRVAYQQLAQSLGRPELAGMPEVLNSLALDKYKSKDASFQERLFNSLPEDQRGAATNALLGLNKDQDKWELKTVKNTDGSETPVYFNPRTAETRPVQGFGTGASKAAQAQQQRAQAADIVVQDIDRALDITKNARDPIFGSSLVTGKTGQVLSNVGGTQAHDVSGLVDTIKANATFDKLQQMRASSPTGAALGAVSDTENKLLGAAIGSLEQSQTEEQFTRNLKRVKKIYNEIIHGPGSTDDEGSVRGQSAQGAVTGKTKSGVSWSAQ